MDVKDLSREQLTELKQAYMTTLVNEGTFSEVMGLDHDSPSMSDMMAADDIVPDEVVFDYYAGIDFTEADFWCTSEYVD